MNVTESQNVSDVTPEAPQCGSTSNGSTNKVKRDKKYDENEPPSSDKNGRKYTFRDRADPVTSNEVESEDEKCLSCPKCTKDFNSRTGLLNHIRMHQAIRKFTCILCESNFSTNKELVDHKSVHSADGLTFSCARCKSAYTDHYDYWLHTIKHTNRASYKCDECGQYYSKNSYIAHISSHFNKQVQCKLCKKNVSSKSYSKHLKEHGAKHQCGECGKVCSNSSYLKYHMRSHTGVLPYQCWYCGNGFRINSARVVHMRTHTDERPYECGMCTAKFRQHTDLQRHMAAHKEKMLSCDICKKMYYHKYSLVAHMRQHTNVDILPCSECDRTFATKQGLRSHVIFTHTTEMPFECTLCERKFKTANKIKRHNLSGTHLIKARKAKLI